LRRNLFFLFTIGKKKLELATIKRKEVKSGKKEKKQAVKKSWGKMERRVYIPSGKKKNKNFAYRGRKNEKKKKAEGESSFDIQKGGIRVGKVINCADY